MVSLPSPVAHHLRPVDCTCADGHHTDIVDRSISDATLDVLIDMETCAAERRALIRCRASR